MENISRKIRFLLQTQGIGYKKVAVWLGVPYEHLRDILDGNTTPTKRVIQKISELCNVKPEFFLHDFNDLQQPTDPEEKSPDTTTEDPAKGPLTFKDLAIKVQALIECLVEKGIITPSEIRIKTEEVSSRQKKRTPQRS